MYDTYKRILGTTIDPRSIAIVRYPAKLNLPSLSFGDVKQDAAMKKTIVK